LTLDTEENHFQVKLTRAVVDSETVALNKQIQQRHLDQNRKVFYCGSWSCDGLPIFRIGGDLSHAHF
jgi:hypothetical protein